MRMRCLIAIVLGLAAPAAMASSLPGHWADSPVGWACVALFAAAYLLVVFEEQLHLRKSIPVLLAAGAIWTIIAIAGHVGGHEDLVEAALRDSILEYAELMLFLLVAMTYINTLEERQVFEALQAWLVTRGFSLRTVFWITGLLAFWVSPVADNMTTALVMSAVALAVGRDQPRFVVLACINIVVAANAGGAFSPFGDITTLMVWQKGKLPASEFLLLLLPSLVNWLVPAALMSLAVPARTGEVASSSVALRPGAYAVIVLFLATIALTVTLHAVLHLPPVLGMMTGLGALKLYGWRLGRREAGSTEPLAHGDAPPPAEGPLSDTQVRAFNSFRELARAEWDTLLFFYGVILCVGGLGELGHLAYLSTELYGGFGATAANVAVGVLSAVIDNIPIMYAVLSMDPAMSDGQWLLVTLTAGVGGSLLSIGSAAGVAVMGQARGVYTFFAHLRWSWAIAAGYAASIAVHMMVNAGTFTH